MSAFERYSRFLHKQQRSSTCAAAAVRTVVHYQFGVRVAESALVALATRPHAPIVKQGSGTVEIRRMVQGASQAYNTGPPWTLRVRRQGTWRQLQWAVTRGRWPIVWIHMPEDVVDHVQVVVDVTPSAILIFDPAFDGVTWVEKAAFHARWSNWYAVVNGGVLVNSG